MKALVYHGPGQKAWEDVPDAAIQEPTDVVVRVDTTTICGTDLHILQGDVAAVTDGRILGHEAVGTVTEVGPAVKGFGVGDRVLANSTSNRSRREHFGFHLRKSHSAHIVLGVRQWRKPFGKRSFSRISPGAIGPAHPRSFLAAVAPPFRPEWVSRETFYARVGLCARS